MVRLRYDLDKIKASPFVADECAAELKWIKKTKSKAGNPILKFDWLILTGPNKDMEVSSYAVLLHNALDDLRMHLTALGARNQNEEGAEEADYAMPLGRRVTLVLAEKPSTKEGRTEPFVGVKQVLPLQRGHRYELDRQ